MRSLASYGTLLTLILAACPLHADDGAASIAAGGLVVLGRETRITMAKEVLKISESKVTVDYDFRNDSDEDVTTEVAFPIPSYDQDMGQVDLKEQGFDDFHLWVDGQPVRFKVQARAFLKGKDYTNVLMALHIDVASFGHATANDENRDIQRLTPAQKAHLVDLGLTGSDYPSANWNVQKKYYWSQVFPAHKTVHIRHEYSPALGSENSVTYALSQADKQSVEELNSMCVDGQLKKTLTNVANGKELDAPYAYVDFILTSANTWKTPIEDFTLIVERPHLKNSIAEYVSFCLDGPVTKVDADHFQVHATDLIPKKELRIGFFDVEKRRF